MMSGLESLQQLELEQLGFLGILSPLSVCGLSIGSLHHGSIKVAELPTLQLKERGKNQTIAELLLRTEVTQHQCHHILLVQAISRGYPVSRGGNRDSTS